MPKVAGIFVPLSVDFADDPDVSKLARFGRDARGIRDLLVQMWCYCKRNRSDGHVPTEQVGKLVYPDPLKVGIRDADRLVEVELAERTDTGYYLPGYLKHNKSRAQIDAESESKREAGRKGGVRSGQIRRAGADMKQGASHVKAGWFDKTNPEYIDRVHSSETETPLASVGGERHLPAGVSAEPIPTHCQDHQFVIDPGPCGGCKIAREHHERTERKRVEAAGACTRCGGSGWIEDADGNPSRKCNHVRSVS